MLHLTHREKHVLLMLSQGHNYNAIAEKLKITHSCLYQHTNHLRKKTGIKDTSDPKECAQYLHGFKPVPDSVLTPAQTQILRYVILKGRSYRQVAEDLGLSIGTVMNTVSQGRQRFKYRWLDGPSRSAQNAEKALGDYLNSLDRMPNGDPLDEY